MLGNICTRLKAGLLVAALWAAGCSDGETPAFDPVAHGQPPVEERAIITPNLSSVVGLTPMVATCGPGVELTLTNFRATPGKVIVTNDATNLYVTYTASTEGWYISETRVAVGRTVASIPRHKRHPDPWAFPYVGKYEPPQKSVTHTIPLADLKSTAGTSVVVAAFAGAVHPKTSDWSGPWEWTTLWGVGNIRGSDYETISNYTIASCHTVPEPPAAGRGVITITFDDGYATTYTNAYPVLKKYGLAGNIAVNPQPIDGGWTGYMTLAQIRQLNADGWTVVSHSVTHADLTKLTAAQLTDELVRSKEWISQKHLRTANVFIVPYHSWGTRERDQITKYYRAARGYTINQFWPERFESWPPRDPYALAGYESEFAPFSTADGRDQTMEYVERAVQEGEFLDLFFHRIETNQLADFEELIRRVAAHRANVRTYGQLF